MSDARDASRDEGSREEVLAKIAKAQQVVKELCTGSRRWTMRVPARPDDDPDLVIYDALVEAERLLSMSPDPSRERREAEGPSRAMLEVAVWVAARNFRCSFCSDLQAGARRHFEDGDIRGGLEGIVKHDGMICAGVESMKMRAFAALSPTTAEADGEVEREVLQRIFALLGGMPGDKQPEYSVGAVADVIRELSDKLREANALLTRPGASGEAKDANDVMRAAANSLEALAGYTFFDSDRERTLELADRLRALAGAPTPRGTESRDFPCTTQCIPAKHTVSCLNNPNTSPPPSTAARAATPEGTK